ncbi:MAG: THUMP domain-containing protein [Candidatus Hodarchaeota archaeon]
MGNESEALTLNGFYDTVLVRFTGEIGIKSERVRKRLLNSLLSHLKNMLKRRGIGGHELTKTRARIYIKPAELVQFPIIHEMLKHIPGVYSYSYCRFTDADLESMMEAVTRLGKLLWEEGDRFAIRVKREGKHEFSSQDVERAIGSHVLENFGELGLKVNLDEPKKTVFLEIRQDRVAVYHQKFLGFGGMPRDNVPYVVGCVGLSENNWMAVKSIIKRGARLFPVLVLRDLGKIKNDLVEFLNGKKQFIEKMHDLLDIQENNKVPLFLLVVPEGLREILDANGIKHDSKEVTLLLSYFACVKVFEDLRLNGVKYLKKPPEVRGIILNYHYEKKLDPHGLDSIVMISNSLESILPEEALKIPKFYSNIFDLPIDASDPDLHEEHDSRAVKLKEILEDARIKDKVSSILEDFFKERRFLTFDLLEKAFLGNKEGM